MGKIGRITIAGRITEFPATAATGTPFGITTGPDANLWFTENSSNEIGRLVSAPASALVLPSRPVPATLSIPQGATVVWTFLGPGVHTLFGGADLIDSGNRSPVSYYGDRLVAAGTYQYQDVTNGGAATVKVPMVLMPASGTASTKFTITWAAAPLHLLNYVFDVQIKRPGSSLFVSWMTGVTALRASFTPDAGAGTYSFRARLRYAPTNAATGYSPTGSIKVS